MATSKDTRVRVEGFSKISISTASAMPAGLSLAGTRLPAFFMAWRHVEDAPERAGVDAVDIEKMSGRHGGGDACCATPALRRRAWATRFSAVDSRCTASAISASVTLSGGSRRTTFSPAPTVSSFSAMHAPHDLAHRRLDLDAGQQAAAAHLLDDVGVLVLDARRAPA